MACDFCRFIHRRDRRVVSHTVNNPVAPADQERLKSSYAHNLTNLFVEDNENLELVFVARKNLPQQAYGFHDDDNDDGDEDNDDSNGRGDDDDEASGGSRDAKTGADLRSTLEKNKAKKERTDKGDNDDGEIPQLVEEEEEEEEVSQKRVS